MALLLARRASIVQAMAKLLGPLGGLQQIYNVKLTVLVFVPMAKVFRRSNNEVGILR